MKSKSKMNKLLILMGAILLIVGVFIIKPIELNKKNNANSITDKGMIFGDINAPVKIYEYSDFNCPDCKKLNENIGDTLLEYINDKKVVLIFKLTNENMYLNIPKLSTEDYKELDKIFNEKDKYTNPQTEEDSKSYLGEDLYNERKNHSKEIKKEIEDLNITVIPTLYVGTEKIVGVYKEEEFKQIVDNILNSKK